VAEVSGSVGGGSNGEDDYIDIHLIQVSATVQSVTKLGDRALLRKFEVFVHSKRLGDIPHDYREILERGYSKNGNVVNVEVPTIRFFGK
jgi:hypothetical protein